MHTHSVDHTGKLVNVSKDERSYILHIHTQPQGPFPRLESFVLERGSFPGGRMCNKRLQRYI